MHCKLYVYASSAMAVHCKGEWGALGVGWLL